MFVGFIKVNANQVLPEQIYGFHIIHSIIYHIIHSTILNGICIQNLHRYLNLVFLLALIILYIRYINTVIRL